MAPGTAVRVLIFDLGGVILRTDDPRPRTQLAEQLGLTRPELEQIIFNNPVSQRAEVGQATLAEIWAEAAARLNLPVEQMPEIFRRFFCGDQVDFALIEWIQRQRSTRTTALLSNGWYVDLPRFLREDLRIPDTFDFIVSSAQRQVAKPNPAIFQHILELTQARPEEAVFVDDFERNINAATALGILTVHFRRPEQALQELEQMLQGTL